MSAKDAEIATTSLPQPGDVVHCAKCRLQSIVDEHGSLTAADGTLVCWCGSRDVERVQA